MHLQPCQLTRTQAAPSGEMHHDRERPRRGSTSAVTCAAVRNCDGSSTARCEPLLYLVGSFTKSVGLAAMRRSMTACRSTCRTIKYALRTVLGFLPAFVIRATQIRNLFAGNGIHWIAAENGINSQPGQPPVALRGLLDAGGLCQGFAVGGKGCFLQVATAVQPFRSHVAKLDLAPVRVEGQAAQQLRFNFGREVSKRGLLGAEAAFAPLGAVNVCTRYPAVKICLSEGGIGWVAGLLDRLDSRWDVEGAR